MRRCRALAAVVVWAAFPAGAYAAAAAVPSNHDQLYSVTVGDDAAVLRVEARIAEPAGPTLRVFPESEPFLANVELKAGDAWKPVAPAAGGGFDITPCVKTGCTVRYEFRLAAAAKALANQEFAGGGHGAFVAPPGSWLVRTGQVWDDSFARFAVTPGKNGAVACGAFEDGAAFVARAEDLANLPACVFGVFDRYRLPVKGGLVDTVVMPGEALAHPDDVRKWVETAAGAVVAYFGKYPVPKVLLLLHPRRGYGSGGGMTYSGGGAFVTVSVGKESTLAELKEDWVLTHEMTHLTFPSVAREHHWIEEGIATYVEPIARVMVGELTARRVWSDVKRDLPHGLPEKGDRGLDNTPTWGRTYWGGALFCLLADVRIREQTRNAKGLRDALSGIVAAGGNIAASWTLEQALAAGDKAVGVVVLTPLYQEMKDKPVPVDLDALWKKLGVVGSGPGVTLDDKAPEAAVRAAIMDEKSR